MKHYGDITKLSGYDLPIVDVITGGSPCQDLSVVGRRAGLDGERSGLFMEQVRIVKEMRDHDRELHGGRSDVNYGLRPRYMVWENVPGAFSSNKGKDFQAVLTEIIRIVEPECPDVPMPEKGKWSKSGCIYDELGGWSIAWRVHDAQFWGVPQRRKRIALVADFGGLSAPEVLFERKGMQRHFKPCGKERQGTARNTESRVGETGGVCLNDQGGDRMDVSEDVAGTLRAQDHGHPPMVPAAVYENHSQDTRYTSPLETAPTVNATYGMGGNNQPFVVEQAAVPYTLKIRCGKKGGGKGALVQEDKPAMLATYNDQTLFAPAASGITAGLKAYPIEGNGQRPSHLGDGWNDSDAMYTLNATEQHGVAILKKEK